MLMLLSVFSAALSAVPANPTNWKANLTATISGDVPGIHPGGTSSKFYYDMQER
jgi:hypothetical protein